MAQSLLSGFMEGMQAGDMLMAAYRNGKINNRVEEIAGEVNSLGGDITKLNKTKFSSPEDMVALSRYNELYSNSHEGLNKSYSAYKDFAVQQGEMLNNALAYIEQNKNDPNKVAMGIQEATQRFALPYSVKPSQTHQGMFDTFYTDVEGNEQSTGKTMSADELLQGMAKAASDSNYLSSILFHHGMANTQENNDYKGDPDKWKFAKDKNGKEMFLIPQRMPSANGMVTGFTAGYIDGSQEAMFIPANEITELIGSPMMSLAERSANRSSEQGIKESEQRMRVQNEQIKKDKANAEKEAKSEAVQQTLAASGYYYDKDKKWFFKSSTYVDEATGKQSSQLDFSKPLSIEDYNTITNSGSDKKDSKRKPISKIVEEGLIAAEKLAQGGGKQTGGQSYEQATAGFGQAPRQQYNQTIAAAVPQQQGYVPSMFRGVSPALLNQVAQQGKQGSSNYGNRPDGTPKGTGWFGELKMTDGSNRVMTENSITMNMDGKEVLMPTVVPTLSQEELSFLLGGGDVLDKTNPIAQSIVSKAMAHAREMIAQGKSPFAENAQQQTQASPIAGAAQPQAQPTAPSGSVYRGQVSNAVRGNVSNAQAPQIAGAEQEQAPTPQDAIYRGQVSETVRGQAPNAVRGRANQSPQQPVSAPVQGDVYTGQVSEEVTAPSLIDENFDYLAEAFRYTDEAKEAKSKQNVKATESQKKYQESRDKEKLEKIEVLKGNARLDKQGNIVATDHDGKVKLVVKKEPRAFFGIGGRKTINPRYKAYIALLDLLGLEEQKEI